jgi:subfamily B ATP-binding cassette protein MsbA
MAMTDNPSDKSPAIPASSMTGKDLYVRLLRHVKPYRGMFALAIFAMVVMAATEPALPALLKPTLDGSFVEKDLDAVFLMSVLIVLLFIVRGVATFVSTVGLMWVGGKVVKDLRNEMFEKLVSLPSSYYDRQASGTLISKVSPSTRTRWPVPPLTCSWCWYAIPFRLSACSPGCCICSGS